VDQEKYPEFDDLDRIKPRNLITYGLVNTFTYRRVQSATAGPDNQPSGQRYDYRQFGRFKLQQSYDIREQRADDASDYANGLEQRPFSPIRAELEFFPGRYVSLTADTEWNPYDSAFLTHNLGAGLEDKRGDRFTIDYHYQKNTQKALDDGTIVDDRIEQETVSATALVKVTEQIFLDGAYARNIEDSQTTLTQIGILYKRQCWSLRAAYEEDEEDRRFGFSVQLHGLGGYGYGTSF
jgi:LPS-assembly protein